MVTLKEFVDFTYSLVNMEEVTENKFPLPKTITFELNESNHRNLQLELHIEKGLQEEFNPENEFFVTIMGIEYKFIKK